LSFTFCIGEKVRTTNITTSKTKKISENSVDDQNIEKIYLSDQNVESQKDQNVETKEVKKQENKISPKYLYKKER
jgi:hypothetical protein